MSAIAAAQVSAGLIVPTTMEGGVIEHTSTYTTIAAGDIVADFDAGGIGVVDGGDVVGEVIMNEEDDDDLSDLDDEEEGGGGGFANETLIDPQSGEFTRPAGKRRSKARVTLRARLFGMYRYPM